ncbi:MAG: CPBP family intramembrane metalloprotease [Flavobacteriales bacterium]|nr:CPBP family intramembrane metalloprotease [Flavobacteriales bacterium]MCB9194134.1 CPBP family intramembrane metalloprotease [Flavobacteriales bacterium]
MVGRRIGTFLLLAYGISWCIAGIGYALGIHRAEGLGYTALAGLFMFGPAIAAIVQQQLIDRRPWHELGLDPRRIRWTAIGITLLIGAAIVPLTLLVIAFAGNLLHIGAFGQVAVTQERVLENLNELLAQRGQVVHSHLMDLLGDRQFPGMLWLVVMQLSAVMGAMSLNLPFMLGEELGWRGYLFHATSTWPEARRIAFTGLAWGLWHAPLIVMGHNYPEHPLVGIPLMVVFCTLLAVLFDRSRRASRTVWGPCVLHGMINGSAGGFSLFTWGGHELIGSPVGMAGFIAIALLGAMSRLLHFGSRSGA